MFQNSGSSFQETYDSWTEAVVLLFKLTKYVQDHLDLRNSPVFLFSFGWTILNFQILIWNSISILIKAKKKTRCTLLREYNVGHASIQRSIASMPTKRLMYMLWAKPGVRVILGLTGHSANCPSATEQNAKYHVIPGFAQAPCGQCAECPRRSGQCAKFLCHYGPSTEQQEFTGTSLVHSSYFIIHIDHSYRLWKYCCLGGSKKIWRKDNYWRHVSCNIHIVIYWGTHILRVYEVC